MKERDGLLAGKEHQTVVSLSMWFWLGVKKSTLAQKNSWEGAEGKGAIAGYF